MQITDIVERLNNEEWRGEIPLNVVDMLEDAADEIERLRAALRGVIRVADRNTAEFDEARAALEDRT